MTKALIKNLWDSFFFIYFFAPVYFGSFQELSIVIYYHHFVCSVIFKSFYQSVFGGFITMEYSH